jgi:hypothetical protein
VACVGFSPLSFANVCDRGKVCGGESVIPSFAATLGIPDVGEVDQPDLAEGQLVQLTECAHGLAAEVARMLQQSR